MNSFVESICDWFDGPVAKTYLVLMQGTRVQIRGVKFIIFDGDIPGGQGSNLVFIVSFGIV